MTKLSTSRMKLYAEAGILADLEAMGHAFGSSAHRRGGQRL